jgi:hypothetical protein
MTTVAAPAPRYRGRPAWRILASLLAIAALVWGTFNLVNLVAHGETRFTRTFSSDAIASVEVSTDRGSVRVIASDRDDVSLSAYVSNGLGGTDHTARVRGHRLIVDASCAVPVAYWCTASYTLRVPRGVAVVLWSGSGDVSVSGPTGLAHLSSQHGDIAASLRRGVDVSANTQHGSIHLDFARAPFRIVASSQHGDVTVVLPRTGEAYRVDASTDHGDSNTNVRTDPDSTRTVDVSSQHGDVTVRYPAR